MTRLETEKRGLESHHGQLQKTKTPLEELISIAKTFIQNWQGHGELLQGITSDERRTLLEQYVDVIQLSATDDDLPVHNPLRNHSREPTPEVVNQQRFARVRVLQGGLEATNPLRTFALSVNSTRDTVDPGSLPRPCGHDRGDPVGTSIFDFETSAISLMAGYKPSAFSRLDQELRRKRILV